MSPGPVTAADVEYAVDAAARTLRAATDRDWQASAGGLDWICWETVEHVADNLFAYAAQLGPKPPPVDRYVPFVMHTLRRGGPTSTVLADPAAGPDGLIQVLAGSGALLAAMAATTSPEVLAYHPYGISDAEGFAAMGVVETLVHMDDVAAGLGVSWGPPAELCDRVLVRLFPDASRDTDRWATLRWATGRGELPGRGRLSSWRWDSTARD